MEVTMKFDVLTLFPEMFDSLKQSIMLYIEHINQ